MIDSKSEKRRISRSPISLSIVVKGRESDDIFWNEVGEIVNVSKLGTSFNLQRECSVGQIISLMINMPLNFRRYDKDKKFYRIWGLVQSCTLNSLADSDSYQIGVAFIGKNAPESYFENPKQSYRISGTDKDGFWKIDKAKTPFTSRAHARFAHSMEVRLAIIDSDGEETRIDNLAVTKDISLGGTAVLSSLEVSIGDCVRFTCEEYEFSSICLVRNLQSREGEPYMLHLSFSESRFPIEAIDFPFETDAENENSEGLEEANET